MSLYCKKTFSLSPLAPWHCWVHWPFISLGWQVWDEGDGVALLSASMSDSLHLACVGMRTRPTHGSLPFIRALHWGLGHSHHRNTTCIASFGHLILLGTTKKVRWLTQGRIVNSGSPGQMPFWCYHAATLYQYLISSSGSTQHSHDPLSPATGMSGIDGCYLLGLDYLLFQVITWKKYRKPEGELCSCLKKMCPTNYRSDRPDGFEPLGEPQEQIANPFAIVYRSTSFWAAINTALWTATGAKASSLC